MTSRAPRAGSRRRVLGLVLVAAAPIAMLGLFFVLPVSGMVARGFYVDGRFAGHEVVAVLARPRIHRVLWFTLWSSAAGTLLAVALGIPTAYALHRLALPGRRLLRAMVLVPFVLPTVVVGVAFRQLLGEGGSLGFLGLDGSAVAIIAALAFFNVAVVVRGVGAAWESLDPRPAEAAAALGASPRLVFVSVTWPALRPAVVGAASVVFLFCATAFGVVLILGGLRYATVETEIYLLTTSLLDLQAAAALSVLQILVVTALLLLAARLRASPDPTVERTPSRPRSPTLPDLPSLVVTGATLLLLAAPMATLVVGSLRVDGGWGWDHYRSLGTAGSADTGGALTVTVADAVAASLRTATDATVLALLLGLAVAVVATRRSWSPAEARVRRWLDALVMLPLGVSAVTLGFGFLITLDEPPLDLRDTPVLVPIAQALVALPLVVRTLVPVLAGVDDRLRQAAASLGASPRSTALVVDLPALWRPLLAGAGFAFAVSLGEFGATSFLAREESPTLPVVIVRLIGLPGGDSYGMALAASVVLAAVTAAVVLAVERLRVPSMGAW